VETITVALATMHGKQDQIQPAFQKYLGWEITVAEIDTDLFGSFDGIKPRELSPKDAALAKAREASKTKGLRFGLGSEGTIGHHPGLPFMTSDFEVLALVDQELELELVVTHLSPNIHAQRLVVDDGFDVEAAVKSFDLPNHAVIVLIETETDRGSIKGIKTQSDLEAAIAEARQQSTKQIILESDFRAMNSPSRQQNIAACAEKLAKRIAVKCPECDYLGFGAVGYEFGLKCRDCGYANEHLAQLEINGCISCQHEQRVDLGRDYAEPAECMQCNP